MVVGTVERFSIVEYGFFPDVTELIITLLITCGWIGRWDCGSVGTFPIALTMSIPSTTCPNAV
jgi:hypothetical protein